MRLDRVAIALSGVLALLVAVQLPGAHAGVGWELSQLAGLAGFVLGLGLFVLPVRPRQSPPGTPLSLPVHELVGWIVLAAISTHGAVALLVDRPTLEYLKPTAPLYQWAGILAGLLLFALTVLATGSVRRRIWSNHRNFQAWHLIVGCGFVVLSAAHVLATDRYAHGRARWALCSGLAIAALASLTRARRRAPAAPEPRNRLRGLAFGRHSALIVGAIASAILALLALLAPGTGLALREPLWPRGHALALSFAHEKHRVVSCIWCHHNYTDRTGLDTCIGCHRSARADLKHGAEARFHGFCLGCHRDPNPAWKHHGPVAGCAECHGGPDGTRGMS